MSRRGRPKLATLVKDFDNLRAGIEGEQRILQKLATSEANQSNYLADWYKFSQESESVYPSQGLLLTPYDYLEVKAKTLLPSSELLDTLRMRRYLLELFNHPYRIANLDKVNRKKFVPPKEVKGVAIAEAIKKGQALAIGDMAASVVGEKKERISRTARYANGPFVKLGRQARCVFVGSSSPDVWNSAAAVATMAASHCLALIPRNGLTSATGRQADLASEVFEWLDKMAEQILEGRSDKKKILRYWKGNVMATIEAEPKKAVERATILYERGVRSFRVYSPEPGTGPLKTVLALREKFKETIEIFAGQVVSVTQAEELVEAGADGIYVGIGGGGRCITGVRSGSVIDWPELVWKMRGRVGVPVVVEGGASDHVAVTLLLGATGIATSRVVSGGTIESPGGAMYCMDNEGKLFKPYGGEASARTKYLDGKMLAFGIPAFVEGETTKAMKSYVKFVYPTLTYNLHLLLEDSILALVFRGVESVEKLHSLNPSPLRLLTASGEFQRGTH